ncbi:MAG: thiamine pyrophosphate-binding protein [Candidatus Nanoarchaeia archaeon]
MKGSELFCKTLKDLRIEFIFSIPGGETLALYPELSKTPEISHILVRHEAAASFMADGYARSSGKPAVVMTTSGPGATNMVIGVATALTDSIPLIAIAGQVSMAEIGKRRHDEIDLVSLFSPITKWATMISSVDRLQQTLIRAYHVAVSGRKGPVFIALPSNILSATGELSMYARRDLPLPQAAVSEIEKVARLLMRAKKPIILAGGGVTYGEPCQKELLAFIESLNIPVATSYNGRGAVPEDHFLSIGRVGEFTPEFARKAMLEADLILALGYRFEWLATDQGKLISQTADIIQVDIDPNEIGRQFPVKVGIHSDAKSVVLTLLSWLKENREEVFTNAESRTKWAYQIHEEKLEFFASLKEVPEEYPIRPELVMRMLRELLPKDSIICADAGLNKRWAAMLFPIFEPRTWIHSEGFAPMGYAFPAAIGAKLGNPERHVCAIIGDGGLQMVASELATAVENNINLLVIVFNDDGLGIIRHFQQILGFPIFASDYNRHVNFANLAEVYGATGFRVENPRDLNFSLKKALTTRGVAVLDVVVDRDAFPSTIRAYQRG